MSMFPAVFDGDILIYHYPFFINRGDIISFWQDNEYLLKRVIGLPGEKVEIKKYHILINDKRLKEHYLYRFFIYNPQIFQLKENEYLVLGDNRSISNDSRIFGPIKREQINGEVLIRIWRR